MQNMEKSISVKHLTRQDLKKNASKRRGFGRSKGQNLAARAVKVLEKGDLVRFNGYVGWDLDKPPEGIYGLIIADEPGDIFHVLSDDGVYKIARKGLDRIQNFWTNDRQRRLGRDKKVTDL